MLCKQINIIIGASYYDSRHEQNDLLVVNVRWTISVREDFCWITCCLGCFTSNFHYGMDSNWITKKATAKGQSRISFKKCAKIWRLSFFRYTLNTIEMRKWINKIIFFKVEVSSIIRIRTAFGGKNVGAHVVYTNIFFRVCVCMDRLYKLSHFIYYICRYFSDFGVFVSFSKLNFFPNGLSISSYIMF